MEWAAPLSSQDVSAGYSERLFVPPLLEETPPLHAACITKTRHAGAPPVQTSVSQNRLRPLITSVCSESRMWRLISVVWRWRWRWRFFFFLYRRRGFELCFTFVATRRHHTRWRNFTDGILSNEHCHEVENPKCWVLGFLWNLAKDVSKVINADFFIRIFLLF